MSYSNGPKIATSNLLLLLDAANTKSYPGSGATWNDLSGNNRNFSLVNTYSYSSNNRGTITFTRTMPPTAEWGGYAQYTGTGSLLSATYLYSNHTTEIVARINNRNPTAYDATESNSALFVYRGFHAMFYYSATALRYVIWNLSSQVSAPSLSIGTTSASDIVENQWFAVTVTKNGNTLSTYLNGKLKSSTVTAGITNGNVTTNQLRIALAADTNQQYSWHGASSVGAVRMYNRVLTDAEIENNFNCTRGRYGL